MKKLLTFTMDYSGDAESWEEIRNDAENNKIKNVFIGTKEFVNVVRCKDCKYFAIAQLKSDYTEDKRYKPSVCINGRYAVPRKPDWFCADGKEKNNDG